MNAEAKVQLQELEGQLKEGLVSGGEAMCKIADAILPKDQLEAGTYNNGAWLEWQKSDDKVTGIAHDLLARLLK